MSLPSFLANEDTPLTGLATPKKSPASKKRKADEEDEDEAEQNGDNDEELEE